MHAFAFALLLAVAPQSATVDRLTVVHQDNLQDVQVILLAAPAQSATQKLDRLTVIRQDIDSLKDLQTRKVLEDTVANTAIAALIDEAKQVSDGKITTFDDLVRLTGGGHQAASAWEKVRGVVTLANVLWVTGGFFVVIALICLFGHYFVALIEAIPAGVWEVILYMICASLIGAGTKMAAGYELVPVLLGAIGLIGCTVFTVNHHRIETYGKDVASIILAVVWSLTAFYYGSHVIGFMAICAILSALGFFMGVVPGVVFAGFEEKVQVPRTTIAAGLILGIHILAVVTGNALEVLAPFREGMVFMGSFVYFLGVLIMASKYYSYSWPRYTRWVNWPFYWMMQVVAVASGCAALYLGTVYQINYLLGIGGTLFYLYIIEKYYDIPWRGVWWWWSLLGLGIILYFFSVFAQHHPQYFFLQG